MWLMKEFVEKYKNQCKTSSEILFERDILKNCEAASWRAVPGLVSVVIDQLSNIRKKWEL